MRRRDVIRRLGAASGAAGLTAVGSGLGAASPSEIRLRWEFADGHAEEMTLAAFDRRDDTPSRAALRERGSSVWASVCCDCPLRGPDCEECSDGCESTLQSASTS